MATSTPASTANADLESHSPSTPTTDGIPSVAEKPFPSLNPLSNSPHPPKTDSNTFKARIRSVSKELGKEFQEASPPARAWIAASVPFLLDRFGHEDLKSDEDVSREARYSSSKEMSKSTEKQSQLVKPLDLTTNACGDDYSTLKTNHRLIAN